MSGIANEGAPAGCSPVGASSFAWVAAKDTSILDDSVFYGASVGKAAPVMSGSSARGAPTTPQCSPALKFVRTVSGASTEPPETLLEHHDDEGSVSDNSDEQPLPPLPSAGVGLEQTLESKLAEVKELFRARFGDEVDDRSEDGQMVEQEEVRDEEGTLWIKTVGTGPLTVEVLEGKLAEVKELCRSAFGQDIDSESDNEGHEDYEYDSDGTRWLKTSGTGPLTVDVLQERWRLHLLALMLASVFVVVLSTVACGSSGPILIDPSVEGALTYDGHGALSAGASSRLLYDYEEPLRSQILDYLYKPKFGASLHHVKVEIGGDSQSTDGTEASHQHRSDDLNCQRGYEWWLLEEARKRNPSVVTQALSWAVPEWVGNDTYYSDDNIEYHISWLKCARDEHPSVGNIDYMGIWNERSWGNPTWVKKFRAALDAAGFGETKLVLPDKAWDDAKSILADIDADANFGAALHDSAIGLHYPCNQPHPEVQRQYGLKYWSSEDYSTEADWAGAGCWGRILSQNFVRMSMTSTISWSLVWSVYNDWPYFGNGLMYAYWPWSGHYTVNEAIWTSAHHCQFTEPGWKYVAGTGTGSLAQGGSYVALTDAKGGDVTIVIEKLHGKCLRCAGQTTKEETVAFKLAAPLARLASLSVWTTNRTHQFVRLADADVDPDTGIVSVAMGADSIVTLSSTSGQQKGTFGTPPEDAPFPFPYKDDFEQRRPPQVAKFFADNGGSFELMTDPLSQGNQVLGQVVAPPPRKNAWVPDVEPITVLGEKTWGPNIRVSADVMLPKLEPGTYANVVSEVSRRCLDVSLLDTSDCASDYSKQFLLDNGLLRVSDAAGLSGMCVSAGPCPPGVTICLAKCDRSASNQMWNLGDDHRLSAQGLCLEVQGSTESLKVALASCDPDSTAQRWHFRASSGYAGVCIRVSGGGGGQRRGNCFNVHLDRSWSLTEDGSVLEHGVLDIEAVAETWHAIAIEALGRSLKAYVGHARVAAASAGLSRTGRVGLVSGWNLAYFDNFAVGPASQRAWTDLGAGCCSQMIPHRVKALCDNYIEGGLDACKARCLEHSECGFISYGWAGSTWCVAWPAAEGCSSLDAGGQGHCGSRGDDGVHSYAVASEKALVV